MSCKEMIKSIEFNCVFGKINAQLSLIVLKSFFMVKNEKRNFPLSRDPI